jgi:DNA-directed RNA polymerase sigma subunit (sigma70/sigma32)
MKCFDLHNSCKKNCRKNECRMWIENENSLNCTILAARNGPMTLQEIGDVFGVTRMRICQLEKRILKKIESLLSNEINLT